LHRVCRAAPLVALGIDPPRAWVFVLVMIAGMTLFQLLEYRESVAGAA
jgi:hypothetical protein